MESHIETSLSPIFTIGHSNRELEEFLELLHENHVEHVVDVRKLPGSNAYPHFNADALASELVRSEIMITRIDALTGRRPVSRTIPFEVNAWWQNRSFHNYADHALSSEFSEALAALITICDARPTAIMCSEAMWWRCHRRIIADHLIAAGQNVSHIMGPGKTQLATLSDGAVLHDGAPPTYPGAISSTHPTQSLTSPGAHAMRLVM